MTGKTEENDAGTTTLLGGVVVPVDMDLYAHMKYENMMKRFCYE